MTGIFRLMLSSLDLGFIAYFSGKTQMANAIKIRNWLGEIPNPQTRKSFRAGIKKFKDGGTYISLCFSNTPNKGNQYLTMRKLRTNAIAQNA